MPVELIAAIVGGVFAIIAGLIPILLIRKRKEKEAPGTPSYPVPEGLSAVVGIVQRGKQVLLVQRRQRIRDLSWQFPAGVVKPGVDPRDKLEREVLQETGVRCKAERFLGARVHEDTRVLCQYFHCSYLGGEASNLDPGENAQVAWVHVDDVRSHITSSIFGEIELLLEEIARGELQSKVALGIVLHDGDVLVVKKRAEDGALDWRFPGGAVESGESGAEAAAREVTEETGVQCSPVRKLGERVHPDTGQVIAYWQCDYEQGVAALEEPEKFSDVAWMHPEDVIHTFGERLFEPVKSYLQGEAPSER
jgi:8-oxo-dGTP diphosphatase